MLPLATVTMLAGVLLAGAWATPGALAQTDALPSSVRMGSLGLYAGTVPARTPAGTTTDHVLVTADGVQRTYRLFVPEGLRGRAPLLVALHGGLGSGRQFEANSGYDDLATSNGFIVAYPDGVARFPDGTGGARTWNAGACCGPAAERGVDDVAFLRAVVADIARSHRVDRDRVYAAGHSNGGMMALRLACEASDVFAAVGAQSASLEFPACDVDGRRAVSSMQIHGSADTNVPIGGGRGSGISGVSFSPPRSAARTLASLNGCRASVARTRDADNRDLILTRWRGCPPGIGVQFLEVKGAGHAWMGHPSQSSVAERYMGPPYPHLDSSRALWAFLAAHHRA